MTPPTTAPTTADTVLQEAVATAKQFKISQAQIAARAGVAELTVQRLFAEVRTGVPGSVSAAARLQITKAVIALVAESNQQYATLGKELSAARGARV